MEEECCRGVDDAVSAWTQQSSSSVYSWYGGKYISLIAIKNVLGNRLMPYELLDNNMHRS